MPAITRHQMNSATQPALTHCSHYLATTHARSRSCPAGLSKQSRRTSYNAPPIAPRCGANRPMRASGMAIGANHGIHTTSSMPVRCLPCSTERRYLCGLRRRRALRTAPIRRCGKAGARHPIFDADRSLPGATHADLRSRSGRAAYRQARAPHSTLRDPSTACTARSTGVDAGSTRANGRRARPLRRYRLFNHRRNLRVARRTACTRQKEQRGFLMPSC